jgi:hypothetical protein
MLFSRRKRATAVEPEFAHADARSNGDSPADPSADTPPTEPVEPVESVETGGGAPPAQADGNGGPDDLEQFFAALRRVVADARAGLPLVWAVADEGALDDAEPADEAELIGTGVALSVEAASTTELAPSTAELIASLEEDRDRWRERAIVWRERAMGADLLVKTLNEHMSDLKINLDDLRAAMQAVTDGRSSARPTAALPLAPPPRRSMLDRLLDPGS